MDGFGGQLVNQLVEKNLIRTVDDLFRLTFNDLIELDRIAEKSAQNILAAITIALFFDVSIEKIIKAIENYQPSNNRSQLLETKKNTLILDAYNANPSSLELAIDNFLNLKGKDKTFIIGSMLELGEASLVEHKKIIKLLSQQKNPCFFIGKEFINAAQNTNANHLSFYQTSKDFISSKLLDRIKNNLILLKGSRGIKLETLIPYL
jgi:UDP-N-acetylmuramoyl-tripeptide--D-alanyl-D-alanine ligase